MDYEDTLAERIDSLMGELAESRERLNRVLERVNGGISREDCDVFLGFYRLNIITSTLIETLPETLKNGRFRGLYLITKRNIKTLEMGIIYALSRKEPVGFD